MRQMEADQKRFADEDKKEWERLKQQEEQRRARYKAQQEETPTVIGAKPAPQ
jgi:hypothetical protein